MGALTSTSPASSAFSVAPPSQGQPQPLTQLPQSGGNPEIQSALLKGLTNYYNGQTAAAGNPNATSPSMGSSLAQSAGNTFDNSEAGDFINSAMGNAAGNGYGAQGATWMNGAGGAAGATDAGATGSSAAGGAATDGAAAGGATGASTAGGVDALSSI